MSTECRPVVVSVSSPAWDWYQDAACLGMDPELFFPVGSTGPAVKQAVEAKAVCRGCPVRAACLEWALTTGQDYGIWGGFTEEERRVLHRQRPREGAA